MVLLSLMLTGCGEEELTPQVDTSNEYEEFILANRTRTSTDSLIYEWYKKYNTYFIYSFRDADIKWQWAGKMMLEYTAYDPEREKDMEMLKKHLMLIKESLLDNYDEEFLRECLPYKIFLIKTLDAFGISSLSWDTYPSLTNNQDAMMIAYLQSNGRAYSKAVLESDLTNIFGAFFYDKLDVKPLKFISSRVAVKYELVTVPQDPKIEEELSIKPSFSNAHHSANVCGFVKGYGPTVVKEPTQQQDFTDYLWFITQNKGSWIRQRTQFYKRLAKRGSYFIEFYRDEMGKNLIEEQNKKFPADPVRIEDFEYQ